MRLLALLGLLLPCVACDQFAKVLAVDHLRGAGEVRVVDGLFRLIYAENPGAFLGLGRGLPEGWRVALFVAGASLMLLAAAVVVVRKRLALPLFVGVALLVAGGVGNIVDRVSRPGGRVVDFAQLGVPTPWGPLQTGIFNVADLQIVAGAAAVVWFARKKKNPAAAPLVSDPE